MLEICFVNRIWLKPMVGSSIGGNSQFDVGHFVVEGWETEMILPARLTHP